MNKQIVEYARQEIKKGLSQLSESHALRFKRMYSHNDLDKLIKTIVDDMPEEKLDWALTQVQNSIKKLRE